MSLWLFLLSIWIAAAIGVAIGGACKVAKYSDTINGYAFENAQLLHENDALREELNERKAKELQDK